MIDLAWSGEALLAMSLSGQVFEVPVELAPPVGLALPELSAGAHPVGLVSLGARVARLGSDCSLVAVSGAQPQAADGLDSCRRLGGSLVLAQADQGEVLARAAEAGLEVLGATPVSPISAHAAADGGWWLVSAERRRLVTLDAQGEELLRFATPFDVMDLVESEDDEARCWRSSAWTQAFSICARTAAPSALRRPELRGRWRSMGVRTGSRSAATRPTSSRRPAGGGSRRSRFADADRGSRRWRP